MREGAAAESLPWVIRVVLTVRRIYMDSGLTVQRPTSVAPPPTSSAPGAMPDVSTGPSKSFKEARGHN
jgi:hypothetical protein